MYCVFQVLFNGLLRRRLGKDERLSSVVIDRWIKWKVAEDAYLVVEMVQPVNNVSVSTPQ